VNKLLISLYQFGFWYKNCYFSKKTMKNQNNMSQEIKIFSLMIDEQFDLVDHTNQNVWTLIINFFK
jgi:hypothetical protein